MVKITNEAVLASHARTILRTLLKEYSSSTLERLDALCDRDLVVVRGGRDPVTRVLDGMDLEYRTVRPDSVEGLSLDVPQVIVVASPGVGMTRDARKNLSDFVSSGGSLITTDQALRQVIAGGIFQNADLPSLLSFSADARTLYASANHGKGAVYHFPSGLYDQCFVGRLGIQGVFDSYALPGVEGHYDVFEALSKIFAVGSTARYDLIITPSGGDVSYLGKPVSGPFSAVVPEDGLTVGRGREMGVQLSDSKASRHHGTFSVLGDTVVYKDELSSNGTIYNGRLVEDRVAPSTGDFLQIGETKLEVKIL